MTETEAPERVVKRVLSKVLMGPGHCHISTYSVGSHGYAQVGWHDREIGRSRMMLCHRVVWMWFRGPIPYGMTVDHMCKNRKCVRLMHLRLLPNLENARRTSGRDWPIGQCVRGHADAAYWRPSGPSRKRGYCSACMAEDRAAYQRRYPERRRAQVARSNARRTRKVAA